MPYDAAKDGLSGQATGSSGPARRAVAVVPNDGQDLARYARCLYIGQAGTIIVIPVDNADNEPQTFYDHPKGYVPVAVRRVLATGTTAQYILALT